MKTTLVSGVTALSLALFVQCAMAAPGTPGGPENPTSSKCSDTNHSIRVSVALSSKNLKVRLYPDARQQVLFFSVNGVDGKVYQLYLFDMDGHQVGQTQIRNKQTTVLTSISEGDYLFQVFTDDDQVENGQVAVR